RILAGATARIGLAEEGEPIDFWDLFSRFAAFKFSPHISIPRELLSGKTAVGQETSVAGTIVGHSLMLFLQDTYEAAKEGGPLMGGLTLGATAFGAGASTFKDSRTAARRKVRNLRERKEYAKAAAYLLEWNQGRDPKEESVLIVKPAPPK
ncbi:hypothetical protein LCGC14_3085440, partial [marine sediment metagenome]